MLKLTVCTTFLKIGNGKWERRSSSSPTCTWEEAQIPSSSRQRFNCVYIYVETMDENYVSHIGIFSLNKCPDLLNFYMTYEHIPDICKWHQGELALVDLLLFWVFVVCPSLHFFFKGSCHTMPRTPTHKKKSHFGRCRLRCILILRHLREDQGLQSFPKPS